MRINIIGAGNLGKTLAYLLHKNGYTIGSICNSSHSSSVEAIKFIGAGTPSYLATLPAAEITFITTPDALIEKIADDLAHSKGLLKKSIVVHCSGSFNSDILKAVKAKDCYVASIHPMHSFAKPELSIKNFAGTYCALEGDTECCVLLLAMFKALGGIVFNINKDNKTLYHAGGVFASNYLITLAAQALSCFESAGVPKKIALQSIIKLMQGSLVNLADSLSLKKSLTGPIQRGDVVTFIKHIEALDFIQKDLYIKLGLQTANLKD